MAINGSLIGTGVIGALLLVGGLSSCSTVDAGEVGLYNRYGQIENEIAQPGLHFINPLTTDMEKMTVQSTKMKGETSIYTKDMQTATVAFAVTYSLDPSAAARMRRTVGHEWEQRLIPPVADSTVKTVFGHTDAINAIANRQALQDLIETRIRQQLHARGIRVESVALTNINYSDAFEHAVEEAQVATQNATAAKNKTVQIEEEARQKIITAEADAKAMQVKSQALSSNPGLTAYEAVKKWDGALPQNMYGSAPIPFLNIQK